MDYSLGVVIIIALILIFVSSAAIRNSNNNGATVQVLAEEEDMLILVNEIRAKGTTCGNAYQPPAPALIWNEQLTTAAQDHSDDMAANNYFSHDSPAGVSFSDRIAAAGYIPYRAIGENLAAGYATPTEAIQGLLTSPDHCMNIMNPNFKEMGTGFASNPNSTYRYYWTQNFGSK